MSLGCIEVVIILIVVGVPVTVVALFVHGARSTAKVQAAELAARRTRGQRITSLLAALKVDSSPDAQRQLFKLLHEAPVGYVPELTAGGGWFERVAPILRNLTITESGAKVVAAYFRCFAFPGGQQTAALEFLAALLNESGTDPRRVALFTDVAIAVLASSSPEEARWLYDRSLAAVRVHRGDPVIKAAALSVGRLSYSAARPSRQPTVYDEQAIANDIAAQSP